MKIMLQVYNEIRNNNCMKILGYKLMRTSEELIETLEENQVVIQNMMTSKYIAFFLTEMSAWQKTLGMVDVVIARSDYLN